MGRWLILVLAGTLCGAAQAGAPFKHKVEVNGWNMWAGYLKLFYPDVVFTPRATRHLTPDPTLFVEDWVEEGFVYFRPVEGRPEIFYGKHIPESAVDCLPTFQVSETGETEQVPHPPDSLLVASYHPSDQPAEMRCFEREIRKVETSFPVEYVPGKGFLLRGGPLGRIVLYYE